MNLIPDDYWQNVIFPRENIRELAEKEKFTSFKNCDTTTSVTQYVHSCNKDELIEHGNRLKQSGWITPNNEDLNQYNTGLLHTMVQLGHEKIIAYREKYIKYYADIKKDKNKKKKIKKSKKSKTKDIYAPPKAKKSIQKSTSPNKRYPLRSNKSKKRLKLSENSIRGYSSTPEPRRLIPKIKKTTTKKKVTISTNLTNKKTKKNVAKTHLKNKNDTQTLKNTDLLTNHQAKGELDETINERRTIIDEVMIGPSPEPSIRPESPNEILLSDLDNTENKESDGDDDSLDSYLYNHQNTENNNDSSNNNQGSEYEYDEDALTRPNNIARSPSPTIDNTIYAVEKFTNNYDDDLISIASSKSNKSHVSNLYSGDEDSDDDNTKSINKINLAIDKKIDPIQKQLADLTKLIKNNVINKPPPIKKPQKKPQKKPKKRNLSNMNSSNININRLSNIQQLDLLNQLKNKLGIKDLSPPTKKPKYNHHSVLPNLMNTNSSVNNETV